MVGAENRRIGLRPMSDHRPSLGRASARERRLARTLLACAASLGWHALLLGAVILAGALAPPRTWKVALKPLTAAQWEANRGLAGPAPSTAEQVREIVPLPPDVDKDPAREERPVPGEPRHLAERDQTVDRETISRYAGRYRQLLRVPQEAARGRKGTGERGSHPIALPGREGPAGGSGTPVESAVPSAPPPVPAPEPQLASAPARAVDPSGSPPPSDSPLPMDGEDGQRMEGRRISGLPIQEYPRPEGGPDLDGQGLDEGAETRLHTRRFASAAYWSEVRARITNDWEKRALVLLKEYDPLEDTYFYKPRSVVVSLTLDATGGLLRVKILESSLLDFYDAIAVAAVREVQPFPQPPPDAIGPDGGASIKVRFTWLPSDRKRGLR
jgi:TonB family protein